MIISYKLTESNLVKLDIDPASTIEIGWSTTDSPINRIFGLNIKDIGSDEILFAMLCDIENQAYTVYPHVIFKNIEKHDIQIDVNYGDIPDDIKTILQNAETFTFNIVALSNTTTD